MKPSKTNPSPLSSIHYPGVKEPRVPVPVLLGFLLLVAAGILVFRWMRRG